MKYQNEVYEYLTKIPFGKVVTYLDIAIFLGNPKLARVIGNILHQNKDYLKYPCYKVVNKKGKLALNYGIQGIDFQKELLEKENIEVINYQVDLLKYRWKNGK